MGWLISHLVARPGRRLPAPARARQRLTSLLVAFSLCWPAAAAAVVAFNSAPALPACCMRGAHHCHTPQDTGGTNFQAVCRTCGVCHALTNSVAHVGSAAATRVGQTTQRLTSAEPGSQSSHRPSRLHGSRAPPSAFLG